jgi:DNA-binding GntR family transcriptional regulator
MPLANGRYRIRYCGDALSTGSSQGAVQKRVDGVVKNGVNARTNRPTGGQHVTRELMHGQILPQIRRDIITGRWPPGARLSEPALCAEFGVSRTPLRDALRVLQAEGLIELVPHVGAIVTQATGPGIGDKMELLIAIEQLAAFKVARQGSAAMVRTIERLHKSMLTAAERSNAERYYRLNDDFHRAIVVGAENASLAEAHEGVMWHVHRARHLANMHEPFSRDVGHHHQIIVDAIKRCDGEAAERA